MEAKGEIQATPRPIEGPIVPVITAVLPKMDSAQQPKPLLTPVLSAVLAVVMAIVVGVVAFRLLAGHWPFQTPSPSQAPVTPGEIEVETTPAGADVYLDRVRQSRRTPLTLRPIRPGQPYELYVHRRGYVPWRQTVALGMNERRRVLRISLPKKSMRFGTLKLSANARADFFLDGRKVATQTRQATLVDVQADADHRLRVVAPGHDAVEQVVRVEPGKLQVLQFDLRPSPREP
jgi:hypothetical protein